MGTQFTSSLTAGDRNRIRQRIHKAVSDVLREGGIDRKIPATQVQKRQLGNAAVREVIGVIEKRDFSKEFAGSIVFVVVLDWLRELRRDAQWNAFSGMIKKYELENRINPIPALVKALQRLVTDTEEKERDKFRVAATSAARSVLAYVISMEQPESVSPNDSPAQILGMKMAQLSVMELVVRYVGSFINEVVSTILSGSDPENADESTQLVLRFSETGSTQIAKEAERRIRVEGKLNDAHAIHSIVLEELRQMAGLAE